MSLEFKDARTVDMLVYQMKAADYPRSLNRARINDLFNGVPPYSEGEVQENNIKINVNDLESTRAGHNARAQYYGAFLRQDRFYSCRTDWGRAHKQVEYNTIVTGAASKVMKRSLPYFEKMRSTFAQDVLHGVGPGAWEDTDVWCPDPIGMDDIFVPADTLLTMKNLPFFTIYRSYTAPELIRLTTGPRVDPGWNQPLVEMCLDWIDEQSKMMLASNWHDYWNPEKAAERRKDSGCYAGDRIPTIDTFQFFYWSDEGNTEGWRRRIILDNWGSPELQGGAVVMSRRDGSQFKPRKRGFLYDSGSRKYADHLREIVSFQFADLSAVAPFRYHSVRSLGFLLYAVCHLQNRLRCGFNVAVFEALMQYFRVSSLDDAQRALKLELVNMGFLEPGIQPVPAAERWQVNAQLVELGLTENRSLIQQASAAYAQATNFSSDRTEKTKFQVMAELQGVTAMLNAGLLQAYAYQQFEYREIFRRLCRKNTRDKDAKEFQLICLKKGIPSKLLVPEAWELVPETIMGAGNTSLQLTIAQQLLEMLPLFDPQAKQAVLRDSVFAITQDAARTKVYVPEEPRGISNSVHDAQQSIGSIMEGTVISPVAGQNNIEICETWLKELEKRVAAVKKSGGVPTPQVLGGLQNLSAHVAKRIVIISADENEKSRVKLYSDTLGKLANEIRAFGQRLQEQMEAQSASGQMDPKVMAEIQADMMKAETQAAIKTNAANQRLAQRSLEFEMKLRNQGREAKLKEMALDQKTAAEIGRETARTAAESGNGESSPQE